MSDKENSRRHWVLASVALARGYIVLGKQPTVIGRAKDCAVPVFSESISRRHAEIRRQGNGWAIVDLGSVNGTYLNGKPVKAPVQLAQDDVITMGKIQFKFMAVEGTREELAARFDPRAEETDRMVPSMHANALLSGTFSGETLSQVARFLELNQHTGVLRIESGGVYGFLRWKDGVVVEAAFAAHRGDKAAQAIVALPLGDYAFYAAAPGTPTPGGSLSLKVADLFAPANSLANQLKVQPDLFKTQRLPRPEPPAE